MRKWGEEVAKMVLTGSSEDEQTNFSKAASASSCALLKTVLFLVKAKKRSVLKRPSQPTVDHQLGT